MEHNKKKYYRPVRADAPECACGFVGHMTADELKKRAAHNDAQLSCPVCGLVHLSREEIKEVERRRIVDSPRYQQILAEAQASE